jgi:toxin ParE1/3/4
MAELIWTEKAVASLEDVYDYIADSSPYYARHQITAVMNITERLKLFPESGRHIPEFSHLPHRELVVNALRIVYRYESTHGRIYIINVIHGSRLLQEDMLSEHGS